MFYISALQSICNEGSDPPLYPHLPTQTIMDYDFCIAVLESQDNVKLL